MKIRTATTNDTNQLSHLLDGYVIETQACGMFLETEKTNGIGDQLYPRVGFKLNEGYNYYEWNNDL